MKSTWFAINAINIANTASWRLEHCPLVYDANVRTGQSVVNAQRQTSRPSENCSNRKEYGKSETSDSGKPGSLNSSSSCGTARRILHKNPYKIALVLVYQCFCSMSSRVEFAQAMQIIYEKNANAVIIMSDDLHFHLNGVVSKRNYPYWATQNPHQLYERPLHSTKVTIWCTINNHGIIGPYFEEHGMTVTVNSNCYINLLNNFLCPNCTEDDSVNIIFGSSKTGPPPSFELSSRIELFFGSVIFYGSLARQTCQPAIFLRA